MLMQFMDRPIVNATELKGNYKVTLDLPINPTEGMPAAQKLTAILGLGSVSSCTRARLSLHVALCRKTNT